MEYWVYSSLDVRELTHSGFQTFVTTPFNTTLSIIRNFLLGTVMRPNGWQVAVLHSPAIARIALSSVKLCRSLSWADCFLAL